MTRPPILVVLDDLANILESVALDYLGEAKTMLEQVSDSLESDDPAYDVPSRVELAARLRECVRLYRIDKKMEASSKLGRISRELWASVDA